MKLGSKIASLLLGVSFAASMYASNLDPACVAGSLATYDSTTSPMGCSVGILNFDNFTFSASGTGGAVLATDSQIEVAPVASGNLGGGFNFSLFSGLPLSVGYNQTATYIIDYRFTIDPGPVAAGADLGMDPPFGNVTITQNYCLDSRVITVQGNAACSNGSNVETLEVDDTNPTASWTTHKNFVPVGLNYGNVVTTIVLNGNNLPGGSGFDGVSGAANITPEPGTIALALGALAAFGVRRRFARGV